MTAASHGAKLRPRLVIGQGRQPAQTGSQAAAPVHGPGRLPEAHVGINDGGKPQADAIGIFLALEIEARQCGDLEALRFAIVNSTRKLAGFDEALLIERARGGGWHVTLASSVHKIDRYAPLVQFFDQWLSRSAALPGAGLETPRLVDLRIEAANLAFEQTVPALTNAYWLPIKSPKGEMVAALALLKCEAWRPQTVSLLIPLASAYGHAWQALGPERGSPVGKLAGRLTRARLALCTGVALIIGAVVPVPMSSLSTAEVVARDPAIVASPLDAVVSDILVAPGTMVEAGTPLIGFSDVDLRNRAELARSRKAVQQARYFKAVQTATATRKDVEEVSIAKAELESAATELAYAEEMLSRTVVRAERRGLIIYSSKSDWVGRPVRTGERIMEIGNPEETELRIEIPVSDALTLAEAGDVSFFLDGDPLTTIKAKVVRASYRPSQNGESQLVYRVHAAFADGKPRRIGLRGVARVSSGNVPLAFFLFRRPIAALRQRFGI